MTASPGKMGRTASVRENPRIAILGTRGIPAGYGGFETFAEEISARLVQRGFSVTVYCRTNRFQFRSSPYRGVDLVVLPTIRHKYLDTVVHTALSAFHSLFKRFDAVLFCNAANSLFTIIPRLGGAKVAINVDGIERKRLKWNALGRGWYRLGEYLATKFPHRIVADAQVIHDYYQETYGVDSEVIAYGAEVRPLPPGPALARLGVQPKDYILYVSRLEPENHAHTLVAAFEKVATEKRLLIVGDAPYSRKYIENLKKTKDSRIVFAGAIYGEGYHELQTHAYCYVQATAVGGTHPALIEAMSAGNCVIANGTPENVEVVGDAGLVYSMNDAEDLAARLQKVLEDPTLAQEMGALAAQRARERYSWETIASQYERLFRDLCAER